jgi:N-succinyldiaminopimelate aminotransferase
MTSDFSHYTAYSDDLHHYVFAKGSPFDQFRNLIQKIPQATDLAEINMTIGAPMHPLPEVIAPLLQASLERFAAYPPIEGIAPLRHAVGEHLCERYHLCDLFVPDTMILPLSGSREGLYNAFMAARAMNRNPAKTRVIMPNPPYAAYPAGAYSIGCEALLCSGQNESGLFEVKEFSSQTLDETLCVMIASPSCPQGRNADLAYWQKWIEAARRHDFILFADECYSDLYYEPLGPVGLLQAASLTGSYDHCVVFHSLSKRSNVPGLRSGFCAGDQDFIALFKHMRALACAQIPEPLQHVSVALWQDQSHVADNRDLYRQKRLMAEKMGDGRWHMPDGGFFLWLKVPQHVSASKFAQTLWQDQAIKVLPEAALRFGPAHQPAQGEDSHIRVALVHDLATTKEALRRLKQHYDFFEVEK